MANQTKQNMHTEKQTTNEKIKLNVNSMSDPLELSRIENIEEIQRISELILPCSKVDNSNDSNRDENRTSISIRVPEIRKRITFLLDIGIPINIIRSLSLNPKIRYQPINNITVKEFNDETIKTLGTINLTIKNKKHKFYVIDETYPVTEDGVLGRKFFRNEEAIISYSSNTLIINNDAMNPVPFLTSDEIEYHKKRRENIIKKYSEKKKDTRININK